VISWWLREASRAITPGTSQTHLNPVVLVVAACLGSAALLQADMSQLVISLAVLTIAATIVRGVRDVLSTYVLIAPFTLFYSSSALVIQLVLGAVNPQVILANSCRITSLALLATTLMSMLSTSELIVHLGKYFPKTALSITLAIKLLHIATITMTRLHEVYRVNVGSTCGGVRGKILLTMALARAATYLSILNSLEVSEALYTRYSVIIEGLRAWR